jgi:hypothetical protein
MNKSLSPSDTSPTGLDSDPTVQESMVERAPVAPNVPDLLRVSPMETTTATDVETSMTDPVVRSQNFVRFTLLNKGILHSHSKLILGLTAPDAADRFFPMNIGVASLIQRCALKVGTKTLQEIDGYNFLTAYKTMFTSNEHQLQREQVQSGKVICNGWRYSNDNSTLAGGPDNDTRAFQYGLENGRHYNDVYQSVTSDLKVRDWANIKNSPTFQIALSDLFPMLKQTQLPLYMMEEQVSIELTFEPLNGSGRACSASGVASAQYSVDTDEVKFVADYIYYPQEMMDAYRNANSTISIPHFDYRHSKVSVSAAVANGTTLIRNLGGAGRIVTKVITGLQTDSASSTLDLSILNKYHSISPEASYGIGQTSGENGSLTANIKYNDRFLYPIDVVNPSRHFHNTAQAEGMVPFVSREEYCAEGTALTSDTFEGYDQDSGDGGDEWGVLGRFNWLSFRLNRNERINSRGLEYFYKYENLDEDVGLGGGGLYTQRSWLELAKMTTLNDGFVTTTLA